MNLDIKKIKPPPRARGNTLAARIEEFLHFKAITAAPTTHQEYKLALRRFEKFITANAIREIGVRAIYRYFIARAATGMAGSTSHQERGWISSFFTWCVKMGYMASNPVDAFPASAFKRSQPNHKVFTEQEYEALKRAAIGTELYYAIVCAWHTAMRMSDVAMLRWRDIDLQAGFISITPYKTRRSSAKKATIPLHPELRELLEARSAIWDGGEFVSDDLATWYQRDRALCCRKFNAIAAKAGVTGRTFHSFRHTALSRWMNSMSADTITVADMSGHVSPAMLARYCQPSMDKKRQIMGLPYGQ